jgi:hypothetical protein
VDATETNFKGIQMILDASAKVDDLDIKKMAAEMKSTPGGNSKSQPSTGTKSQS